MYTVEIDRYSTAGGKVSCVPRYPTVSHKFPRDILCPVVIRSISENFCDYHGTWLSSRYNHRNFQTWVITTELSGHDVSRGNLWDTVGYRETRGNFTTSSTVYTCRSAPEGCCLWQRNWELPVYNLTFWTMVRKPDFGSLMVSIDTILEFCNMQCENIFRLKFTGDKMARRSICYILNKTIHSLSAYNFSWR